MMMRDDVKTMAKVVAVIFFYLAAAIAVVVAYRAGWFARPLVEARISDACWLVGAHALYTRLSIRT